MPDGRPGDHPLTDITIHGAEYFDAETNARIRRIVNGAPGPLISIVDTLIWTWPRRSEKWTDLAEPQGFRAAVEAVEDAWRDLARAERR